MEENPLWQFSVSIYGKPGIESLLLRLQDDFGADVNMLLCAVWLGQQGILIHSSQWQALNQVVESWRRECVVPLRSVRRFLKLQHDVESLREQLKMLGLEAECYQQALIYQQLLLMDYSEWSTEDDAVAKNLQAYVQFMGLGDKESLQRVLGDLNQLVVNRP